MKNLSDRETEVLKLIALGNKQKQVAEQLGISPSTVSGHITSISHKLGFSGVANLTRYALEIGIITQQLNTSN